MPDECQIYPDERWVRVPTCASHHEGWDTRECYRFEYPDGRKAYADFLSDEQAEMLRRQIAERLERDRRILTRHAA